MSALCVCEHCRKPGTLSLFRLSTPINGVSVITAKVLCVGCGEKFKLPRWFA